MIVQKVLGQEFYPPYFRLRKLSNNEQESVKGNIMPLKAVVGIKNLKALEGYLGRDQEAQDKPMEINEWLFACSGALLTNVKSMCN